LKSVEQFRVNINVFSVLWVRIGFNADPDPYPAFFISMLVRIRIQEAITVRIQANPDPDPGQTFESQKVEFYMKNILEFGNRSKNIHMNLQKFFERQKTSFIGKFWSISMLPDPHSIPNTDPYPGHQN
jgi:hypothetical protein